MYRIYKFQLEVTDIQIINLSKNAHVLSVQVQNGIPCIWALVKTDSVLDVPYRVNTYGTGHCVSDHPGSFLGTYQLHDGALVFHVFYNRVA